MDVCDRGASVGRFGDSLSDLCRRDWDEIAGRSGVTGTRYRARDEHLGGHHGRPALSVAFMRWLELRGAPDKAMLRKTRRCRVETRGQSDSPVAAPRPRAGASSPGNSTPGVPSNPA